MTNNVGLTFNVGDSISWFTISIWARQLELVISSVLTGSSSSIQAELSSFCVVARDAFVWGIQDRLNSSNLVVLELLLVQIQLVCVGWFW